MHSQKHYICDSCNVVFASKQGIQEHIFQAHSQKLYMCKICTKSFSTSMQLSMHIRSDHPEVNKFECNGCDRVLEKISSWKRHVDTHLGVRTFKCGYCPKAFAEKGTLIRHTRIHTGETPFKCDMCGRVFRSTSTLARHMAIIHKPLRNLSNVSDYDVCICKDCGLSFNNQFLFRLHKIAHTATTCRLCGESCKNTYFLGIHLRKEHKMIPNAIRKYKKVPSGPLTCEVCGKVLSTHASLQNHLALHKSKTPYICNWCDKNFVLKSRLAMHLNIHLGKPFVCEKCGASFTQKGNLIAHTRMHTGELFCKLCMKTFSVPKWLQHHLKRAHHVSDTDLPSFHMCFKKTKLEKHETSRNNKYVMEDNFNENMYKKLPSESDKNDFEDPYLTKIKVELNESKVISKKENQETKLNQAHIKNEEESQEYLLNNKECGSKHSRNELHEDYESKSVKTCKENTNDGYKAVKLEEPGLLAIDRKPQKNNTCPICSRQYSTPTSLRTHIKVHSTDTLLYKCDYCEKAFRQKSNMLSHKRTHYSKEFKPKYPCSLCPKMLSSKTHVKRHIARVHEQISLKPQSKRKHACTLCDKKFDKKKYLEIHTRTHTGERPYVCALCGVSFNTISTLRRHEKKVHAKNRSHPCKICDRIFIHAETLDKHNKVVHSDDATRNSFAANARRGRVKDETKKYDCPICQKSFNRKDTMTLHTKLHSGTRPYECMTCFKAFAARTTLIRHRRIHNAGHFECMTCHMVFKQSVYLKKHMVVHAKEPTKK